MKRRRLWIALGVSAALLVGASIATPIWIRSRVEAEAEKRGFSVEIRELAVGGSSVWLSGVHFRSRVLPSLEGELEHVEVRLGWSGPRAVYIHGGRLSSNDSRESLRKAFGPGRGEDKSGSKGERRLSIAGDGIFVGWRPNEKETASVWGLAFEREAERYRIRADLARATARVGQVELRGMDVELAAGFVLTQVRASSATATVQLEALSSLADVGTSDAIPTPAPGHSGTSPVGLSPGEPGGSTRTGLVGALFALDPGRGARLQARVSKAAGIVARRLPENAELDLRGVRLRIQQGQDGVTLGPAVIRVRRDTNAVSFSFLPGLDASVERQFSMTARLPLAEGESEFQIEGGPVPLADLGVRDGDLGLREVARAKIRVKAELRLSSDASTVSLDSAGEVSELSLSHPAFGSMPLSGIELGWRAKGDAALDGSHVAIESGELSVGAVNVKVEGNIDRTRDDVAVRGTLEVPLAACSEMLASIPHNLVPFARDVRMDGTFSWSTSLSLDTADVSKMGLKWRMQNDCRFASVPKELSPERFRGPFVRDVPDPQGVPKTIVSGPGSGNWVPIALVSPYLEAAVLVSEDGRFWAHNGFDQRAIESSIRQNVQAGRFMRGASTISMQLAKNLYLTREKTLSRKVQEALLTMLIEQELRKDEILELYFNVVELGPGIFGVKEAAEYYFRSEPADLSVAQCFFLASVLPSPTSEYFDEAGYLKPRWTRYVQRLMKIAAERERISEIDLESGLEEEIRFGVPHQGDDASDAEQPPLDFETAPPL